jgi:hypothetical protein
VARSISPEDRVLIERIRMVNKALSIFVFALQECDAPESDRLGIADMLTTVADVIREEASQQASSEPQIGDAPERLQIEALQGSGNT